MRFPFFIPALAACSGIVLAEYSAFDQGLLLVAALVISLASLILVHFIPRLSLGLLALASLLLFAGAAEKAASDHGEQSLAHLAEPGQNVTPPLRLAGVIDSPVTLSRDTLLTTIRLETVGGKTGDFSSAARLRLKIILSDYWKQAAIPVEQGNRVGFVSRIHLPSGFDTPGALDTRRLHLARGLSGTAVLKSPWQLELLPSSFNLAESLFEHRQNVSTGIRRHFDGRGYEQDLAALQIALTTGERGFLDKEYEQLLRAGGLMHIIAISGFHVGIIALAAMLVLRILRLPPSAASLIQIAIIVLYWAFTGMSVATSRAALLIISWITARMLGRDGTGLNLFSLIALALLLQNPSNLFDPGFQLSFAAAFGILCFPPLLEQLLPFGTRLPQSLRIILSAQIWTFPLVLFHFNYVVSQAVISNFILLPLASLLVILGAVYAFLVFWIPVISSLVLDAVALLLLGLDRGIELLVSVFPWSFRHPSPEPVVTLVCVFLLFCAYLVNRYRLGKRAVLALTIAPFALLFVLQLQRAEQPAPSLAVLDCGMGDSNLVILPDGRTMVIDAGGSPIDDFDYGEFLVSRYLWERGITSIDYLLLTHFDADHAEGAIALLQNFNVGKLLVPFHTGNNEISSQILETAERRRIPVVKLKRGISFHTGGMHIDVLNPPSLAFSGRDSSNNNSMILLIDLGRWRVFVPGDAEKPALESIAHLIKHDGEPVLLKAPHHGSRDALSKELLRKLKPEAALISASRRNVYGFPHGEVIAHLQERGIPVFQTGKDGTLLFREMGGLLRLQAGRGETYREFSINLPDSE